MFSVIIGLFFSILNNTLLNVAYTDLSQSFQISETTVQWLSTAYMLIVGVLVPISALLMQWITTRQMFIGAMSLFTLGTLICSTAPIFNVLLIGRTIQAMGAGFLFPLPMTLVLLLYPPHERGKAIGMISLVIMFAPAIGPTLSGIIIDHLTWRWLFISVLPFATFSIVFALIYLRNVSEVTKPAFDLF